MQHFLTLSMRIVWPSIATRPSRTGSLPFLSSESGVGMCGGDCMCLSCVRRKLETTHIDHVRGSWDTVKSGLEGESGALMNHISAFWKKHAPSESEEPAVTVCTVCHDLVCGMLVSFDLLPGSLRQCFGTWRQCCGDSGPVHQHAAAGA